MSKCGVKLLKNIAAVLIMILVTGIINSASAVDQVISVGSVLNITVLEYPELSKSVIVRQDGTTEYPLLLNIPVDGLTVSELREFMMPLLTRYVERPKLFINISEYKLLTIKIQGAVERPGTYQISSPIDIQGTIAHAGGLENNADLRKIMIIRREGQEKQVLNINLLDAMEGIDAEYLPEMKSGDIVIVNRLTIMSYVRVIGSVRNPGRYIPIEDANVVDMISMAGGTTAQADWNRVYYIAISDRNTEPLHLELEKIISEKAVEQIPVVAPGDIIIVNSKNDWERFSYWVQLFRDLALLASTIVLLQRLN